MNQSTDTLQDGAEELEERAQSLDGPPSGAEETIELPEAPADPLIPGEVQFENTKEAKAARKKAEKALKKEAKANKKANRYMKKRVKKGKFILLGLVVLVGGYLFYQSEQQKKMPIPVATQTLMKGDLTNSVTLTGTVQSAASKQIYGSGGTIETVNVQVGDTVQAGDLLAQMETEEILLSIAEQQALMENTKKLHENTMNLTEKKLETAKEDLQNGLNDQLAAANNALKSAQQALNESRRDYNDAKDDSTYADLELTKAEKANDRAKAAFDEAERAYNVEANKPREEQDAELLGQLREKLNQAETELNKTLSALHNAESVSDITPERTRYREARVAYENALTNKTVIENQIQQQLDSYQDDIKTNALSGDTTSNEIALKRYQKQLQDSTVRSPISGMVTAVYAKEGAQGSGLLFVVEDVDRLIVKTSLKEYDIASVKQGMPVTIKSDATGEEEFEGVVEKIYPTAIKDQNGETKTEGTVEFETDVALTSGESKLRVGMNVRLNIVTAEKQGVYSVAFDSVTDDMDGNTVLYTLTQDEEGKSYPKAVTVTPGMETDFYLEVSGTELTDGMQYIADPNSLPPEGKAVLPMPADGGAPGGAESVAAAVGG